MVDGGILGVGGDLVGPFGQIVQPGQDVLNLFIGEKRRLGELVLGKCQFFFRSGAALNRSFAEGAPGAGIELTLALKGQLCFRAEYLFCPFLQLGHGNGPSGHIFPAGLED